eukprot:4351-Heterococcus_DN1.PRE.3
MFTLERESDVMIGAGANAATLATAANKQAKRIATIARSVSTLVVSAREKLSEVAGSRFCALTREPPSALSRCTVSELGSVKRAQQLSLQI